MRKVIAIDLILFWGLIGTIGTAHALLLTSGTPWETTTWFYIVMWISSMIVLLFCRLLYKEAPSQFDYDEGVSEDKLLYWVGGLVATLFVSSILVQAYSRSSIWVPTPSLTLTIGTMSLGAVINDIFYQIALVSNSEETLVLALSQVIRRRLSISFSVKSRYLVIPLSLAIPRAGWAILHAYVSYVGPLMPILVLSAFISGMIISYMAYNKKTRSFLIAVFIHAGFNIAVVLASALGLI